METALTVMHTSRKISLKSCAQDHTSFASGTMKYEGAVGFLEKLNYGIDRRISRMMHHAVFICNAQAKFKEAIASKVEDVAHAPVHPTFTELALRPRTV
jgi:hypothetical protein